MVQVSQIFDHCIANLSTGEFLKNASGSGFGSGVEYLPRCMSSWVQQPVLPLPLKIASVDIFFFFLKRQLIRMEQDSSFAVVLHQGLGPALLGDGAWLEVGETRYWEPFQPRNLWLFRTINTSGTWRRAL